MYVVTYQLKSDASFNTMYFDTLPKAKSMYAAMKTEKKIFFVTLSKVLEHAHP